MKGIGYHFSRRQNKSIKENVGLIILDKNILTMLKKIFFSALFLFAGLHWLKNSHTQGKKKRKNSSIMRKKKKDFTEMKLKMRLPPARFSAISFFRASSWPRDQTHVSFVSFITGRFFTHWVIREASLKQKIQTKLMGECTVLHRGVDSLHQWI